MKLEDIRVGMTGTGVFSNLHGQRTFACEVVNAAAGKSKRRILVRPTDGSSGDLLIWPSQFTQD